MIRVPLRIDQSSQSAKQVPTVALGYLTPARRHLAMAFPPGRNSPNSAYNRDSASDNRAHSPEEQLKRTIVLAILSICAFLLVALLPGRPAQTSKRPHFTDHRDDPASRGVLPSARSCLSAGRFAFYRERESRCG